MRNTIDSYIFKIILNKYYDEWNNNPKINKLECFYPQFNDLHIFDKIENDLINLAKKKDLFTEEQINSIGWEERFEIIHYLMEHRTHHSIYVNDGCYVDYLLEHLRKWIIDKSWHIIFNKYALLQIAMHFTIEDEMNVMDAFFETITKDFSIRTAIAKIKRNKIYILGLEMKLSMRDCGINLTT
jgi:hypothetical protein